MWLESGQATQGGHKDAPGSGMDEGTWDRVGPADGMAELAIEGRWSRTNRSYSNGHLQAGLVLLYPLVDGPTDRARDPAQQEIEW